MRTPSLPQDYPPLRPIWSQKAERSRPSLLRQTSSDDGMAVTANESISHDGVAVPARCGVSHIWVAADQRRVGVARQLLDAVRRNMVTGYEVPVEQLAFSQPTVPGRALAAAYTRTERFLVYTT